MGAKCFQRQALGCEITFGETKMSHFGGIIQEAVNCTPFLIREGFRTPGDNVRKATENQHGEWKGRGYRWNKFEYITPEVRGDGCINPCGRVDRVVQLINSCPSERRWETQRPRFSTWLKLHSLPCPQGTPAPPPTLHQTDSAWFSWCRIWQWFMTIHKYVNGLSRP